MQRADLQCLEGRTSRRPTPPIDLKLVVVKAAVLVRCLVVIAAVRVPDRLGSEMCVCLCACV